MVYSQSEPRLTDNTDSSPPRFVHLPVEFTPSNTDTMSNRLSLDGLPAELYEDVCNTLPKSDLLALRRVNHYCRRGTTRPLIEHIESKLRSIRTLTTEEALTTITHITAIPEWRDCIQTIEFVDPGYHGSTGRNRWFCSIILGPLHLEAIANKVSLLLCQ